MVLVKGLNESLDGYVATKTGVKSCAQLAVQQACVVHADWAFLTNFDETRLYYSRVQRPEDGLVVKLKFTEYESKFDKLWLASWENSQSDALEEFKRETFGALQDDRVTALLKAEGPLTRRQILEKLGSGQSFEFPWYIQKFGSRKRKVYYIEGQEDAARKTYENMIRPKLRPISLAYPNDYFLNLLNLKPQASPYFRASDGTPDWWERRANKPYICSTCRKSIEKGERYIGRRKLIPGMRGPYGHRGSYVTDCYHVVCLLKNARGQVSDDIEDARLEIKRLETEIACFKEEIPMKEQGIKACKSETRRAKEQCDRASRWRKLDRWVGFHLTSWTRGMEISRLENEIAKIENKEIPEREAQIGSLNDDLNRLSERMQIIEARMKELDGLR